MYDIILNRPLVNSGELTANQKIPFTISDEMKQDIEKQKDRDIIVMWMINLDEDAVPLGFNYVGFDDKKLLHKIEVFYFNRRVEWSNKMREDELKRRIRR